MKTSTKLGLAAVALFGSWKALNFFTKASKIESNISTSATIKNLSLQSITAVKVLFGVNLTNYSGFDLSVSNVFSKLILVLNDNAKIEAGTSTIIPSITFADKQTKPFDVSFSLSYLTLVSKILSGSIKQIQIVTYYDFKGQQIPYTTSIDYAAFMAKAKNFVKAKNSSLNGGNDLL